MTTTAPWQYDEAAHPGTDFTSAEEVELYDRKHAKLRDIPKKIAEILDWLEPAPDQALLDMGCGTGALALTAAGRYGRILAVDISPTMTEWVRKEAGRRGLDNVEVCDAGFLSYEHRGPKLDAYVSLLAMHHLPDFWKLVALKRAAAMLRPGGRLFLGDTVYSFDLDDHAGFFNAIVNGVRQIDGDLAEEATQHIRDEFSTVSWLMEQILERAGFEIENADYRNGWEAYYRCVRR